MKVFRNILSCVYIGATVCSVAFFASLFEFPLTIGAGSWAYSFGFMLYSDEPGLLGLLGLAWLTVFWVLLLIASILAYKGKFTLLCVFSAIDSLVTAAIVILSGIVNFWDVEQTFLLDGVVTLLITAAMITATALCREKEMRTDVDDFLAEQKTSK